MPSGIPALFNLALLTLMQGETLFLEMGRVLVFSFARKEALQRVQTSGSNSGPRKRISGIRLPYAIVCCKMSGVVETQGLRPIGWSALWAALEKDA